MSMTFIRGQLRGGKARIIFQQQEFFTASMNKHSASLHVTSKCSPVQGSTPWQENMIKCISDDHENAK